jgi:hypothetical protein
MRIASLMTLGSLAVALSMGTASYAALAETQTTGQSMTFTGMVQGVDVGQGIVVVRGPKQDQTPPGVNTGQTSVIITIVKLFKIDQTTKISVGGQSKTNIADIKNGDPISVSYVQTTSGQMLAKSVTDSNGPAANQQPPRSSYY